METRRRVFLFFEIKTACTGGCPCRLFALFQTQLIFVFFAFLICFLRILGVDSPENTF